MSCKIFTSSVASASKKFENRPKIPSMPDVFIRPASQVCQRIKPSISRICTSNFKNFNPRVLQQKTIIAFLLYCFQFNYTLVVTSMIDKFLTVLFIKSILFSFYPGQILSAVRLKICPPRTKFVKSRQTICTCEMLMMTENNLFASAERH